MDRHLKELMENIAATGRSDDPMESLHAAQESLKGVQAAINTMLTKEFTAFDAGDHVSATVTSGGLRSVNITPRGMRDLDNEQLAAACIEAIRNARVELAKGMRTEMHNLSGADLADPEPADVNDILERLKRF